MIAAALALLLAGAGPSGASLPSLLSRARAEHPQAAAARARLDRARADLRAAGAAWFPEVSVGASASRTDDDIGATTTTVEDVNRLQASLSQRLYDFGRTPAAQRAARARIEAAATDLVRVDSEITVAVTERYIETVAADRLLELRRRTVEARGRLREQVARLVEAGVRPRSDMLRAEIDLENARLDLTVAEAETENARHRLSDAAGLDLLPDGPLDDLLAEVPRPPNVGALAEAAVGRRPEVEALRARLRAAAWDVRTARRDRWPVLSATSSYLSRDRDVDRVGQPGLEEWTVGATLGWSGWNWAGVSAAVAQAEADEAGFRANLADLERSARVEVLTQARLLAESIARTRVAGAVVRAAEENLSLVRMRYEAGVSSILDVADAQVQLTDAEATEIRARADARTDAAALERVAGTGW